MGAGDVTETNDPEVLPATAENLMIVLGLSASQADEIMAIESGEIDGDIGPLDPDEK